MILRLRYIDLTRNPELNNHNGFSENLLGFFKIPLSSMSNRWNAHAISTGIKTNHNHKGLT